MIRQTLVEKIVQKYTHGLKPDEFVSIGDIITIRPAYILTHDNTGAVIPKFQKIGGEKLSDSNQPVFALDHNIQDTSDKTCEKYKKIESFAREMSIDFYPAGRGIGHQVMIEEGYVWPGTLVVASDSHANMYGGLGCLGTPVVRTDAAAIWATGKTWWQVPPVARVKLTGKLQPHVSGKDVILTLCWIFNQDEVLNHAIEFIGDGAAFLEIEDRLTIANMTTEWGALAGLFPVDDKTLAWLRDRIEKKEQQNLQGIPSHNHRKTHPRLNQEHLRNLEYELNNGELSPDQGACYGVELELDLSTVVPRVAGPHTIKMSRPAGEFREKEVIINKAYLVSCVNARVADLAEASHILKGNKIAEAVSLYVSAASKEIQDESEKRGDWQIILNSGAIPLPPGCGPCIGLGQGLLQDGEVGISATNRNFTGRMGSKNADIYLASPAVVAQSAISGYIDVLHSTVTVKKEIKAGIINKSGAIRLSKKGEIVHGFPETIEGELIFCHQDNLNTDGIYPGKYTYLDYFTPQQQAEVAMENYDPEFRRLVHSGDILVVGFNFGTGSSREQAATTLITMGIRMVLGGSFSETYKRNALNNGLLTIEVPELVKDFKKKFGTEKLTVKTGFLGTLDVRNSVIKVKEKSYRVRPIGLIAQELIIMGGLEKWVKEDMKHGAV